MDSRSGTATPHTAPVAVREEASETSHQQLNPMHPRGSRFNTDITLHRPSFASRFASHAGSLRGEQGPLRLQNTYQLAPDADNRFDVSRVRKAMNAIMTSQLDDEKYDAEKCAQLSLQIAEKIKNRVKEMHFSRYKLVCNVTVGQHTSQSISCVSRCLWNTNSDNSASETYTSAALFAVATVHGIYVE